MKIVILNKGMFNERRIRDSAIVEKAVAIHYNARTELNRITDKLGHPRGDYTTADLKRGFTRDFLDYFHANGIASHAEFVARAPFGGRMTDEIMTVEIGFEDDDAILSDCICGCRGNYTDHSMRAGESGRSPSVIVR